MLKKLALLALVLILNGCVTAPPTPSPSPNPAPLNFDLPK
jgi:PBP1b-binding outer membrane lipoprotein LpoB